MKVEKIIVTEDFHGNEVIYRAGDKDVEICVKGLNKSNRYKNQYEAVVGDIKEITDNEVKFYVHYCEVTKINYKNVVIPFENIK